jgi:hypothetical protein
VASPSSFIRVRGPAPHLCGRGTTNKGAGRGWALPGSFIRACGPSSNCPHPCGRGMTDKGGCGAVVGRSCRGWVKAIGRVDGWRDKLETRWRRKRKRMVCGPNVSESSTHMYMSPNQTKKLKMVRNLNKILIYWGKSLTSGGKRWADQLGWIVYTRSKENGLYVIWRMYSY